MERMLSFTANALSDKYDVSVVTAFNEDRPDHFAFAACTAMTSALNAATFLSRLR